MKTLYEMIIRILDEEGERETTLMEAVTGWDAESVNKAMFAAMGPPAEMADYKLETMFWASNEEGDGTCAAFVMNLVHQGHLATVLVGKAYRGPQIKLAS